MTATVTISALERELGEIAGASRNARWQTALFEMGGLTEREVIDHARRLHRLAGPETAVGWLDGLRVGLLAGLKASVTRPTTTIRRQPPPPPGRHLTTLVGLVWLATGVGALALVWMAVVAAVRAVL